MGVTNCVCVARRRIGRGHGLPIARVDEALRVDGRTFESALRTKNATAAAPEVVLSHLSACDAVVLAIAD